MTQKEVEEDVKKVNYRLYSNFRFRLFRETNKILIAKSNESSSTGPISMMDRSYLTRKKFVRFFFSFSGRKKRTKKKFQFCL